MLLSNPKKIYIVIGIAYIRQIPDLRLLFSNLLVDHFLIHTLYNKKDYTLSFLECSLFVCLLFYSGFYVSQIFRRSICFLEYMRLSRKLLAGSRRLLCGRGIGRYYLRNALYADCHLFYRLCLLLRRL